MRTYVGEVSAKTGLSEKEVRERAVEVIRRLKGRRFTPEELTRIEKGESIGGKEFLLVRYLESNRDFRVEVGLEQMHDAKLGKKMRSEFELLFEEPPVGPKVEEEFQDRLIAEYLDAVSPKTAARLKLHISADYLRKSKNQHMIPAILGNPRSDSTARARAAELIVHGKLNSNVLNGAIVQMLGRKDISARELAAELSMRLRIDNKSVVHALLETVEYDPSPAVRKKAAFALIAINPPKMDIRAPIERGLPERSFAEVFDEVTQSGILVEVP